MRRGWRGWRGKKRRGKSGFASGGGEVGSAEDREAHTFDVRFIGSQGGCVEKAAENSADVNLVLFVRLRTGQKRVVVFPHLGVAASRNTETAEK